MQGGVDVQELDRLLNTVLPGVVRGAAASGDGRLYRNVMSRVEMPLLRLALELSAGNQLKAARMLGINRNTLRKKLLEHGIDPGGAQA